MSLRLELGDGAGIFFDWSKTHLDDCLLSLFEEVAVETGFVAHRASLFKGEPINVTENRAATHMAQRGVGADTDTAKAGAMHNMTRGLVGAILGRKYGRIDSLIHIGIGGSALGPALAIHALSGITGRIAQISRGLRGRFGPTFFPAFQGRRSRTTGSRFEYPMTFLRRPEWPTEKYSAWYSRL